MRRLIAALGAAFILAPAAASSADCTVQWRSLDAMLSAADLIRPAPDRPVRSSGPGVCTVSDVTLLPDARVSYRVRALAWSGEGVDRFLSDGTPPSSVSLRMQGVRAVAADQGRMAEWVETGPGTTEATDLRISAAWDASGRLLIETEDLGTLRPPSVWVDASVDGVDLSSVAAAKASAATFSVTSLKADIGMNESLARLLLTGLSAERIGSSEDPDREFAIFVAEARSGVDELPDASFPVHSRVALNALLSDLPKPEGRLFAEITATPGFGAENLLPLLLRRPGGGFSFGAPLTGVRVDLRYER